MAIFKELPRCKTVCDVISGIYLCPYLLGHESNDDLGQVVQRVDNAIHRINHYPVDSVLCIVIIYPLDSDLSGG